MSYPAQDLGPTVLATAYTLTGVSTVVVSLRFYCRAALMRSVKSFDYLIGGALLLTWGIAVINYFQVKYGTGRHMNDQPAKTPEEGLEYLEGTLKSWYTYQLVYLVDLAAIKFSILFFYRAISSTRVYRWTVYTVMFLVGAFTIGMVFVNAFECDNPSDAWSTEILLQADGTCHDLKPIYFGQAGFNIASDLAILVLPIPIVWNLQMKRQKRLAVISIFSIGSIAVLASIIRIYSLWIWATDDDTPYQGARILIWSQIELNTAIISSSFPALRPLFSWADGFTTAKPSGYVRYGDPRSHGTSGLSASRTHKSQIAAVSNPYPLNSDTDYLEHGKAVPLTTIRSQHTPPSAHTPTGTPNGSMTRSNSSTVTAGRWNKSRLRPNTSDASSDEQTLTRYSEETQGEDGYDRRQPNGRNMGIPRTVEVEVRRDMR